VLKIFPPLKWCFETEIAKILLTSNRKLQAVLEIKFIKSCPPQNHKIINISLSLCLSPCSSQQGKYGRNSTQALLYICVEAVGQCGKVFRFYSNKELELSSVGPDQFRVLNCASSGAFYCSKSNLYTVDSSMGNLCIRKIYGISKSTFGMR